MKKLFASVIIVIVVISVIYLIHGRTNQDLESSTTYEITTTGVQGSAVEDNRNHTNSLEKQLYNSLTEDEKEVYDSIYEAIYSYEPSTTVNANVDSDRIFDILYLVIDCHPEFFWVHSGGKYYNNGNLDIDYLYTKNEIKKIQPLIEQKAKEIIEEIGSQGDEYSLSLAIYDYIVKNTTYNNAAAENTDKYPEASTIEGVLLDGTAICGGYSKAYRYLLSLVGIDAITITGYAQTPTGSDYHAWVAQKVNGEIYLTDPTWGDGYEDIGYSDFVNHVYFLTSSAEIKKTHQCDEIYKNIKTTSERDNYFKKKNTYFEKYDLDSISNAIKTSVENNEIAIELKFANVQECKKAKEDLIDRSNIYAVFKTVDPSNEKINTNNITYNVDDTHNVITIFYD